MSPGNQKVLQIKTLETKPDEKKGESKRLSLGILGWLEGIEQPRIYWAGYAEMAFRYILATCSEPDQLRTF